MFSPREYTAPPTPSCPKICSLRASLLSLAEDLTLVNFNIFSYITTRDMARDRDAQAQMTYHFLQHLDRSGFENVSYLRQQFNDYKETIEEAAKLEPVRKTSPKIKYLG